MSSPPKPKLNPDGLKCTVVHCFNWRAEHGGRLLNYTINLDDDEHTTLCLVLNQHLAHRARSISDKTGNIVPSEESNLLLKLQKIREDALRAARASIKAYD